MLYKYAVLSVVLKDNLMAHVGAGVWNDRKELCFIFMNHDKAIDLDFDPQVISLIMETTAQIESWMVASVEAFSSNPAFGGVPPWNKKWWENTQDKLDPRIKFTLFSEEDYPDQLDFEAVSRLIYEYHTGFAVKRDVTTN